MIAFLKRHLLVVFGCILIFILFFTLAFCGHIEPPELSASQELPPRDIYQPTHKAVPGAELALVFIGSSQCAFSTNPDLPRMIEHAKNAVKETAVEAGMSFSTLGVAKDWNVDAGIAHLSAFGRFDEIMAGRSWMNEGVLKYIWQTLPGAPSTPQVLVVERMVTVPLAAGDRFKVSDESVITRKIGLDEIEQWVEAGMPLPNL